MIPVEDWEYIRHLEQEVQDLQWCIKGYEYLEEIRRYQNDVPNCTFTELFNYGCKFMELDENHLVKVLQVSRPILKRWHRGTVVPPAAKLVLQLMKAEVLRCIKERQ